jgi:hypothetical protein
LRQQPPAAAKYFFIILYLVFALAERKNQIQKEDKVPLRSTTFAHRVSPVNNMSTDPAFRAREVMLDR